MDHAVLLSCRKVFWVAIAEIYGKDPAWFLILEAPIAENEVEGK